MKKKCSLREFMPEEKDRIIEMAWEDRTPFEAITAQFGLAEAEVIRFLRQEIHPRSWKKWRARVQGRETKHERKRISEVNRFKSDQQRAISCNRTAKRRTPSKRR
ncbi:MAG: TIGR03643 family protein [Haliscomenobacter sp.]|nr:TIGR03643 family protein [Haliscomenobacter sp.]